MKDVEMESQFKWSQTQVEVRGTAMVRDELSSILHHHRARQNWGNVCHCSPEAPLILYRQDRIYS